MENVHAWMKWALHSTLELSYTVPVIALHAAILAVNTLDVSLGSHGVDVLMGDR